MTRRTTAASGTGDVLWEVGVSEDPDWGFARNFQVLLKTGSSEFSCSAFSTRLRMGDRDFYGPNRDYPWQGLLATGPGGSQYKVVDGIYLSPGSQVVPERVLFGPGIIHYLYRDAAGEEFSLALSLDQVGGKVVLNASASGPCDYAILVDMTPTDAWPQAGHQYTIGPGEMLVEAPPLPTRLRASGFDHAEALGLNLHWTYKLGDGFRQWAGRGIAFVARERSVFVPAVLRSPTGHLSVEVPVDPGLSADAAYAQVSLPVLGQGLVAEGLRMRMGTLARYGLSLEGDWFPEAGSWWFRRPWLRDALEGIRWNLETYVAFLRWPERLLRLVRRLISLARASEGLPLIAGDGPDRTSDAPPQLLNVAIQLAERLGSRPLLSESLELAGHICDRLLSGQPFSRSVLRHSIVCSPANSSWVDSVTAVDGRRWPTRLPMDWFGRGLDPFRAEYGLVEVNALYIEALSRALSISETGAGRAPAAIDDLLSVLASGFRACFAGDGIPKLTVCPSLGMADPTPGSPGVVAVSALLGSVYAKPDARRIWQEVQECLLVERTPVALGTGRMPFGILVRAGGDPYLGDDQYHGSVTWPRDTPYLIRLMEAIGEEVAGVLLSNLDHMMFEGAVGYCHELFSLPAGGSPGGSELHLNPVPVKNPAQYWSHWCDPYLEHLGELGLPGPRSRDTYYKPRRPLETSRESRS